MATDDFNFSLMSDEELETSLQRDKPPAAHQAQLPYTGPEHRCSGSERRQGLRDRREMVRFEPGKILADRRSVMDRRKANNALKDLWPTRDF